MAISPEVAAEILVGLLPIAITTLKLAKGAKVQGLDTTRAGRGFDIATQKSVPTPEGKVDVIVVPSRAK
ncbi:hypothetical protein HY950_02420, partial [Candidatus Gottesmanbacteria bacterium]|nr:hypothetical protein [Candidatus Gottesmanbacteria bacterium]